MDGIVQRGVRSKGIGSGMGSGSGTGSGTGSGSGTGTGLGQGAGSGVLVTDVKVNIFLCFFPCCSYHPT